MSGTNRIWHSNHEDARKRSSEKNAKGKAAPVCSTLYCPRCPFSTRDEAKYKAHWKEAHAA